jgi:sugar phosphate isomerase/epimerase
MSSKTASGSDFPRRDFLKKSALASLALITTGSGLRAGSLMLPSRPDSKIDGVQIGVITYSYRSMPGDITQILKYIVESGISATELMGEAVEQYAGKPSDPAKVAAWRASVSMKKFEEVRKMFHKAGVSIYAFKPNALGVKNTDEEIDYAMRATKALGADTVTVELPKDPAQSKRLGEFGEKHKVFIGYHAHLQATDTAWDTALSQSRYNTMNLDCGHYIAAGGSNSPESLLALIKRRHDRISSLHLKDRTTKAHGAKNLPWGEGDTPIKQILTLIKENKYRFPATIELEYQIPEGSDAVKEVKKCLAYAKNALS